MENILVTDFEDSGDNVMVFSAHITTALLKSYFDLIGQSYTDIEAIPDKDMQFYIYEPLWMDISQERNLLAKVSQDLLAKIEDQEIHYEIMSPDGFATHWEPYTSQPKDLLNNIKKTFDEWKKRYELQGYYSSNTERIPLSDLRKKCVLQILIPDPLEFQFPLHKKNLSLL